MDPSGINRILTRRAVQAGYERGRLADGRPISPHGLRHTAITLVARQHGLLHAQAFARHANLATTRRYIDDAEQYAMGAQSYVLSKL